MKLLSAEKPVIIDESDDSLDAFPRAKALGYKGVSSKTCKGIYKSLINAARCKEWGDGYFMTGEDLTIQAGLALQQDLALVSLLGLTHVERNGHHYVNGMAGLPRENKTRFSKSTQTCTSAATAPCACRSQGNDPDEIARLSRLRQPRHARLERHEEDAMSEKRIGIIMHGVTGRMGMNQHLIRSILEIRKQGGVALKDGTRVMPDPILVGRNAAKVEELAKKHGVERWTTDLDGALKSKDDRCSSTPPRPSCARSC